MPDPIPGAVPAPAEIRVPAPEAPAPAPDQSAAQAATLGGALEAQAAQNIPTETVLGNLANGSVGSAAATEGANKDAEANASGAPSVEDLVNKPGDPDADLAKLLGNDTTQQSTEGTIPTATALATEQPAITEPSGVNVATQTAAGAEHHPSETGMSSPLTADGQAVVAGAEQILAEHNTGVAQTAPDANPSTTAENTLPSADGSISVPSSPEGADTARRADEAGVPSVAEQVAELDRAAASEPPAPDGDASLKPTDGTNPPDSGDKTNATPDTEAKPIDADAQPKPTDGKILSDIDSGREVPTAPTGRIEGSAPIDGEQKPSTEGLTPEQAAKVKEMEATLKLGENLDKLGIKGTERLKVLEQIAASGSSQETMDALNTILSEIPSAREKPGEALQKLQDSEKSLLDQIRDLVNQENGGQKSLTEAQKKKFGWLKKLLRVLKIISIAVLAAPFVTVAAVGVAGMAVAGGAMGSGK